MKFDQLRKMEERYEKAGEYLDRTIDALRADIKKNLRGDKMTPQEMKFQLAGMLGNVTNVSTLLDVSAEAIFRLAQNYDNSHAACGHETGSPLDVFGPKIDVPLTGPQRSGTVPNDTTEGGEDL